MKSIKMSEYFKIIYPQYVYLKLTPANSIRNYNSDKIAKAVASLYRGLLQRMHRHNKKFFFEAPSKIAYYIYIEKNRVEFYFVVPANHLNLIKEKIGDTWHGITISKVESIPVFSDQAIKYKLTYRKEDALSLAIDRRTNTLLGSILNVVDIIEEGDRIGVFYNFIPVSQYSWRAEYERTIKKLNDNYPIDREKLTVWYALKIVINVILELTDIFSDTIGKLFGETEQNRQTFFQIPFMQQPKVLQPGTQQKKDSTIVETQMLVFSESENKMRASNSAYSVCEAFKSISSDNELSYRKYTKKTTDLHQLRIPGVDAIKTSPQECQNFIALPGREILEEHRIIEKVDTFENEVPEELQKGVICIGGNIYRGKTTRAYLTNDKEFKNLTVVIIGPTRAGKTTLIGNISNDTIKSGECTVLFDFCGNCELSNDVSRLFSNDRVLSINCSEFDKLQGLGFNEVTPLSINQFEVYRCAKTKTSQLMTLINSLNADDSELKARMERYLEAAAVVVFIQDGPIKDVFGVLQDHMKRARYICGIPADQSENLAEYVSALEELDEWSKGTRETPPEIIGTKLSNVQGILNRVNKLKQNTYMELMLKKDCSNNINLVDEMQKSQLICIRMPEIMFSTEQEKDVYATYWLTKIWGALQKRKWDHPEPESRVKVNIIFDELYQVPNCQEFLRSKLSQIAKFSCKPVISCHYLGQIGIIRNELKAANSSYMLIAGCDKDNYTELKDELYPYTVEDLLNLKRYHSLNLLRYEQGYAKFITKLPPPV